MTRTIDSNGVLIDGHGYAVEAGCDLGHSGSSAVFESQRDSYHCEGCGKSFAGWEVRAMQNAPSTGRAVAIERARATS